ncbi:tetratricopeptide repeat protein, partial [Candidatus Fermentibacterales bacterium]|nr:tetratricopeptide repeat protein [Candidatus Fermentibacterales bacterium]
LSGRQEVAIQAAHHYCRSLSRDKARVYSLVAARLAQRRNANRQAISWLERFLELADDQGRSNVSREDLYYAFDQLGELYSLTGEGASAESHLRRALELAETGEEKARTLGRIGNHYYLQSAYEQARKAQEQALEIATDPLQKAEILCSLVFLDFIEGRTTEGLALLENVARLAESAGEGCDEARKNGVMATYYLRMGDFTHRADPGANALEYFDRALELFRQHGDISREATVLNNMCETLAVSGEHERAVENLRKAEDIWSRLGDALGLAIVYHNLAEQYTHMSQMNLAREYFHRYLETSREIDNRLGEGYGKLGLGKLLEQEGDLASAESHYGEAMKVFEELGGRDMLLDAVVSRGEMLALLGRLDEAREMVGRLEAARNEDFGIAQESGLLYLKGLLLHLSGSGAEREAVDCFSAAMREGAALPFYTETKRRFLFSQLLEAVGDRQAAEEQLRLARVRLEKALSVISDPAVRSGMKEKHFVALLVERSAPGG